MLKFDSGRIVITQNANKTLNALCVINAIDRHILGDWGELCDEDIKSNNQALNRGKRLLSSYKDVNNVKFWIITESDRSYTTILLQEDY